MITCGVSGTSQAAPYVANVVGQIREINPGLSSKQTKEVLLGTVDRKDFLKDRVVSGGIVNSARAQEAAKFTLSMGVSESIEMARKMILDRAEEERPALAAFSA